MADFKPEGLRGWTDSDWKKFVSQQGPEDGRFPERHFNGYFGGQEIVMLAALAKGYLPPEYFARSYGHSSKDLLEKWGNDLQIGLADPVLDELGINSIEFVENMLARVSGILN